MSKMPITNYENKAARHERNLFGDPLISDQNKKMVRRFLQHYDVTVARKALFLERLVPLLRFAENLAEAMDDRDGLNTLFYGLRQKYSPATYSIYTGVSLRYLRWLNDGKIPDGARDIKNPGKKQLRRKLDPGDMITWEDCTRLASHMTSNQTKAMLFTQLDGGFRPSEFVDLRYSDVKENKGLLAIYVRDGKTGPRNVVLQRCVPYLMRWLDEHPSKKPNDPLWVLEQSGAPNDSKRLKPCTYPALRKRFKTAAKRAGLSKPVDTYNFRHSSCVLDKRDNLPLDLAADRHGHSVQYFTQIYGRLSTEDVMNRFRDHYDIAGKEEPKTTTRLCQLCAYPNEQNANHCYRCHSPMTTEAAIQKTDNQNMELSSDLNQQLESERQKRLELELQMKQQATLFNQQMETFSAQIKAIAVQEIREKMAAP